MQEFTIVFFLKGLSYDIRCLNEPCMGLKLSVLEKRVCHTIFDACKRLVGAGADIVMRLYDRSDSFRLVPGTGIFLFIGAEC